MKPINKEDLILHEGKENLLKYQWNKEIAQHFFCKKCGIYTHHNPRSNPSMTGFNVGCVDEIDVFKLKEIEILDGNNHPLDKK